MPDDFDLEAVLEDVDEEVAQQIRDAAALILAGLDQMREELQMPWQVVTQKRLRELAGRLALDTSDYSPYDGLLVGSWMAASSRTQLLTHP